MNLSNLGRIEQSLLPTIRCFRHLQQETKIQNAGIAFP